MLRLIQFKISILLVGLFLVSCRPGQEATQYNITKEDIFTNPSVEDDGTEIPIDKDG